MIFQVTKNYKYFRIERKEFLEKHPDSVEIKDYQTLVIVFIAAALFSLFLGFASKPNDMSGIIYVAMFVWMALMFITYAVDAFIKRRSISNDDGFLYDLNFYRYRSIKKLSVNGKLFKKYYITFYTGNDILVSKNIYLNCENGHRNWKNRKKDKKKK